jgi:hypothetical protein
MRTLFGVSFAVTLTGLNPATAADGCGPGRHAAVSGACVAMRDADERIILCSRHCCGWNGSTSRAMHCR